MQFLPDAEIARLLTKRDRAVVAEEIKYLFRKASTAIVNAIKQRSYVANFCTDGVGKDALKELVRYLLRGGFTVEAKSVGQSAYLWIHWAVPATDAEQGVPRQFAGEPNSGAQSGDPGPDDTAQGEGEPHQTA